MLRRRIRAACELSALHWAQGIIRIGGNHHQDGSINKLKYSSRPDATFLKGAWGVRPHGVVARTFLGGAGVAESPLCVKVSVVAAVTSADDADFPFFAML